MIDYDKYLEAVVQGSIDTIGNSEAIAHKLDADLNAGDITLREAEDFAILYQVNEGIDLRDYL